MINLYNTNIKRYRDMFIGVAKYHYNNDLWC